MAILRQAGTITIDGCGDQMVPVRPPAHWLDWAICVPQNLRVVG